MLFCDALLVLSGKHIHMYDIKFIMLSIHDINIVKHIYV